MTVGCGGPLVEAKDARIGLGDEGAAVSFSGVGWVGDSEGG